MTSTSENPADDGSGLRPGDILVALRRRAWLIVLLGAIGGLAAVAFALSMPNTYEGVATVQIDPRKKTIVSLDAVLPDIAGDTPTIESQVEILRSSVIALKVIEALGLRDDPEFGGARSTRSADAASASGPQGAETATEQALVGRRRLEDAMATRRVTGPDAAAIGSDKPERDPVAAAFSDRLKTTRIRNSLIVEISFRSRDPVKAARIANTIAEVYIRDQIDMKVNATGLAAELLGPKLDGLRAKLAEAEQRVARFKSENGIFDAEGQLLSEKQLSRLMEQSVIARNASAEARARYELVRETMRSGDVWTVGEVLQSHTVRTLKDQLARATKHEAELLTKYGARHPEIAKVRAEIGDIQSQTRREVDKILANVKGEYQVAAERERGLEQGLAQLKAEQSVSKEVTVKLRDLEREAETSRRIYETFLGRYKQTLETQDLHLPDARIVEKADVPSSPVAPKRKQIALIGLVLGLGLGTGLSLLLELMRKGLDRADDAEAKLGIPLLATVPMLKRQTDGLGDPMLSLRIVLAQPRGAFASAIHRLRDGLELRRTDASAKLILVTACLPNEGTTVIAANLALSLAQQGRRTLIVDGDLRRSKLTQNLGLEEAPGLIDAIGRGQDFETVIVRDTVSGVAVIPAGHAGRVPLPPQELLQAPGFAQRLARLKAHFDTIIIDAPPLLPVIDARALAGYADQIVLVATWKRTPLDLLRRAIGLLGGNAALLAGIVLNQMDPAAYAKEAASRPARGEPKRRQAA